MFTIGAQSREIWMSVVRLNFVFILFYSLNYSILLKKKKKEEEEEFNFNFIQFMNMLWIWKFEI